MRLLAWTRTLLLTSMAVCLLVAIAASRVRAASYSFRLKVVRQAGLPFQGGASPVVSVDVRP
jgi:hypothetical protein